MVILLLLDSCPQCGHRHNQQWLQRQQQKLLPVDYFMVTFTLPSQLRGLALTHPKTIYSLLLNCAKETLQTFSENKKALGGRLGLTAILHTHTRQLDYHPHVHVILPAGALSKKNLWRKNLGDYLFNGRALGKVFKGKFIAALKKNSFYIKEKLPEQWIVDCKKVGSGAPALKYLARYLYRGVINEKNLLFLKDHQITWQYRDSKTKKMTRKTESVITFLQKVLIHVLPKGFRRVRDYGLLHGAAKTTLKRLQLMLRVFIPEEVPLKKLELLCQCCGGLMNFSGFIVNRKLAKPT